MDAQSLIAIIIGVIVVYFFVKFIVSPVVRAILGVIIFIIAIYLLQKLYGFNLLSPFGISLSENFFERLRLDWILSPAVHYGQKVKNFLTFIWDNFIKNFKQ